MALIFRGGDEVETATQAPPGTTIHPMPNPPTSDVAPAVEEKALRRAARTAKRAGSALTGGVIIGINGVRWDPRLHPRDSRGRFIETGGVAKVWGTNRRGRVVRALGGGKVELQFGDGHREVHTSNRLTMTTRPNGQKPTKNQKRVMREDARRASAPKRGDGRRKRDFGDWDGDGVPNSEDVAPRDPKVTARKDTGEDDRERPQSPPRVKQDDKPREEVDASQVRRFNTGRVVAQPKYGQSGDPVDIGRIEKDPDRANAYRAVTPDGKVLAGGDRDQATDALRRAHNGDDVPEWKPNPRKRKTGPDPLEQSKERLQKHLDEVDDTNRDDAEYQGRLRQAKEAIDAGDPKQANVHLSHANQRRADLQREAEVRRNREERQAREDAAGNLPELRKALRERIADLDDDDRDDPEYRDLLKAASDAIVADKKVEAIKMLSRADQRKKDRRARQQEDTSQEDRSPGNVTGERDSDPTSNEETTDGPDRVRPGGRATLEDVPAEGVREDRRPGEVLPEDRTPGRSGGRDADRELPGRGTPPVDGQPREGRSDQPGQGQGRGDRPAGVGVPAGGDESRQRRTSPGLTPNGDAPSTAVPEEIAEREFIPQSADDLSPRQKHARAQANIAALRLLRTLQAENRPATQEERRVLAKWGSWGALKDVFERKNGMDRYDDELRDLLSDEEYADARRTTMNAHYTAAHMVQSMWAGMERLGFDGGDVLEPGSGIGNFIGMSPDGTKMHGVELDSITAQMSSALYPDADIANERFERFTVNDGDYDAAIGNVPFSDVRPADPVHNKGNHVMHDAFIIKAMRGVRPGGTVMMMTSAGTLDKKNSKARQEMAELGDFIGAVRLPGGAHKDSAGTAVVTDVLMFRRRKPGQRPAGHRFDRLATVTGADGREREVNEYFAANPQHVLGQISTGHGMYRGESMVVDDPDPDTLPERFRTALRNIATQAQSAGLGHEKRPAKAKAPARAPRKAPTAPVGTSRPARRGSKLTLSPDAAKSVKRAGAPIEGRIVTGEDGNLYIKQGRDLVELPGSKTRKAEIQHLMELRDIRRALLEEERTNREDTPLMGELRAALNTSYDEYVAKYGPVNRVTFTESKVIDPTTGRPRKNRSRGGPAAFRKDALFSTVDSLEEHNPDTGVTRKTAIFEKRAIRPAVPVDRVETPEDALAIALDRTGRVDLDQVSSLLGLKGRDQARAALGRLVFTDPDSGQVLPREQYLAGDTRRKLKAARAAAADNPEHDANVTELEAIVPADLRPDQIDARPGAPWIPLEVLSQYAQERFGAPGARVENPGGGAGWIVDVPVTDGNEHLARSTWGVPDTVWDAGRIFESVIKQSPIRVTYTVDGKTVTDAGATKRANDVADMMRNDFKQWIFADPDRGDRLSEIYNDTMNSLVPVNYDGREVTVPGLAHFTPQPHQHAAIARITAEPATLLAHEVGFGKTLVMQASSMKLRQLGKANKPAHIVPNHMLEQYTREFYQAFPDAKILVAQKSDLSGSGAAATKAKREAFAAKAANGDWDAVIFTHSAFELMPMSPDRMEDYLNRELDQLRKEIAARKAAGGKASVKREEKQLEQAEAKLRKKIESAREKGGVTFEDTGIDYLFVDEAHLFKNLMTQSRIPGAGITGSGRASDMHMKMDHLRQVKGRDGAVGTFATATPLSNSMTEAYTMTRFMRPDLLEDAGLESFDRWAAAFGELITKPEVDITGQNVRMKARFAEFTNLPEMLRSFRAFADVKLSEDADLPVPDLRGDKPKAIISAPSRVQSDYLADLARRAEEISAGNVDPKDDNLLKISGDGRKAALDLRLVGVDDPDGPSSKLRAAADNITAVWQQNRGNRYLTVDGKEHETPGALQVVFADLGTPKEATPPAVNKAVDRLGPVQVAAYEKRIDMDAARADAEEYLKKLSRGALEEIAEHGLAIDISDWDEDTPKSDVVFGIIDVILPTEDGVDPIPLEKVEFDPTSPPWSAYQQLKDDLIARGMPAEQIAFIHDAKDDAQKARLFADAREGRIQVLIGSTAKMGVGTNIQDRAVALHHLDVPWRPADLQQRDGRVIRQRNQNAEVDVYRYVTDRSFDSFMWQGIGRKAAFINAAMRGDMSVRKVEDLSQDQLDANEIVAASTGNPWLMKKAAADAHLASLVSQAQTHEMRVKQAAAAIRKFRDQAEFARRVKSNLERLKRSWKEPDPENWSAKVNGRSFTKRADADAAMRKALADVVADAPPYLTEEWTEIGEIGGVKVLARGKNNVTQQGAFIALEGAKNDASWYDDRDLTNPESQSSPFTSLTNTGRKVDTLIERTDNQIDAAEKNGDLAYRDSLATFGKQEQLNAARERAKVITELISLQGQSDNPEAQDKIDFLVERDKELLGAQRTDEPAESAMDIVEPLRPAPAGELPALPEAPNRTVLYDKAKSRRAKAFRERNKHKEPTVTVPEEAPARPARPRVERAPSEGGERAPRRERSALSRLTPGDRARLGKVTEDAGVPAGTPREDAGRYIGEDERLAPLVEKYGRQAVWDAAREYLDANPGLSTPEGRRAAAADRASRWDETVERARQAFEAEDWSAAVARLDDLERIDPDETRGLPPRATVASAREFARSRAPQAPEPAPGVDTTQGEAPGEAPDVTPDVVDEPTAPDVTDERVDVPDDVVREAREAIAAGDVDRAAELLDGQVIPEEAPDTTSPTGAPTPDAPDAAEVLREAQDAVDAGDFDRALDLIDRAENVEPGLPNVDATRARARSGKRRAEVREGGSRPAPAATDEVATPEATPETPEAPAVGGQDAARDADILVNEVADALQAQDAATANARLDELERIAPDYVDPDTGVGIPGMRRMVADLPGQEPAAPAVDVAPEQMPDVTPEPVVPTATLADWKIVRRDPATPPTVGEEVRLTKDGLPWRVASVNDDGTVDLTPGPSNYSRRGRTNVPLDRLWHFGPRPEGLPEVPAADATPQDTTPEAPQAPADSPVGDGVDLDTRLINADEYANRGEWDLVAAELDAAERENPGDPRVDEGRERVATIRDQRERLAAWQPAAPESLSGDDEAIRRGVVDMVGRTRVPKRRGSQVNLFGGASGPVTELDYQIAKAVHASVTNGRPTYIGSGRQGYSVSDSVPPSDRYWEVTPDGRVFERSKMTRYSDVLGMVDEDGRPYQDREVPPGAVRQALRDHAVPATPEAPAAPAAPTLRRTPDDVGTVEFDPGQVVTTVSGRSTTPFPRVDRSTNRRATATQRRVDEWLLENAKAEADARGINHGLPENAANITPSERDEAEDILFNPDSRSLDGTARRGRLRPLTPEAPADATPEPERAQMPDTVRTGGLISSTPEGSRRPPVNDPDGVLTDKQIGEIERVRREVVATGDVNSTGGPSCGVTSEELGEVLGGREFYGAYRLDDGSTPEHAWVVLPDGTIVDPTADQFGQSPVEVIKPGDARAARYLDQAGDDDGHLATPEEEAAAEAQHPEREDAQEAPTATAPERASDDVMAGIERHTPEALPGEAFPPTQQQQDVIDAVLAGKDTVVQAKAGSGKTTTLAAIARRIGLHRPKDRVAYIAFNTSVAAEARGKMPSNTEPRTGHSIAVAWAPDWMRGRLRHETGLRRPDDVARHLGINDPVKVNGAPDVKPDELAQAAIRTVEEYAKSADDKISADHLPPSIKDLSPDAQKRVLAAAEKAWADLNNPDGRLFVDYDHIRKAWALTRPDLSKPGSGLKRAADVVFLDEAQDTPPVLAKVVADQKVQKVIVGDADQAIYGFTGARDYLSDAGGDLELPLNKSWRFGPAVADAGNRFLQLLGSKDRVVGGGDSRITEGMGDADAVLVRTNSGMFDAALDEIERGRLVGVPKGTKAELRSLVRGLQYLTGETSVRPERMHDDLAQYRTWDELKKAAEKGDDKKAATIVRLVEAQGLDRMERVVGELHEQGEEFGDARIENFPDRLAVLNDYKLKMDLERQGTDLNGAYRRAGFRFGDLPEAGRYAQGRRKGQVRQGWFVEGSQEERDAALARLREALHGRTPDVIVSTAHKAKGLEWGRVRIGDDFRGPKVDQESGETVMPDPEELRLSYVAVTRAEKELDPGSLSWVYDHTSPNGTPEAPESVEPPVRVAPEDLPTVDNDAPVDITPEVEVPSSAEPTDTPNTTGVPGVTDAGRSEGQLPGQSRIDVGQGDYDMDRFLREEDAPAPRVDENRQIDGQGSVLDELADTTPEPVDAPAATPEPTPASPDGNDRPTLVSVPSTKAGLSEAQFVFETQTDDGHDPGFVVTKNSIDVHDYDRALEELDWNISVHRDNLNDPDALSPSDRTSARARMRALEKVVAEIRAARDRDAQQAGPDVDAPAGDTTQAPAAPETPETPAVPAVDTATDEARLARLAERAADPQVQARAQAAREAWEHGELPDVDTVEWDESGTNLTGKWGGYTITARGKGSVKKLGGRDPQGRTLTGWNYGDGPGFHVFGDNAAEKKRYIQDAIARQITSEVKQDRARELHAAEADVKAPLPEPGPDGVLTGQGRRPVGPEGPGGLFRNHEDQDRLIAAGVRMDVTLDDGERLEDVRLVGRTDDNWATPIFEDRDGNRIDTTRTDTLEDGSEVRVRRYAKDADLLSGQVELPGPGEPVTHVRPGTRVHAVTFEEVDGQHRRVRVVDGEFVGMDGDAGVVRDRDGREWRLPRLARDGRYPWSEDNDMGPARVRPVYRWTGDEDRPDVPDTPRDRDGDTATGGGRGGRDGDDTPAPLGSPDEDRDGSEDGEGGRERHERDLLDEVEKDNDADAPGAATPDGGDRDGDGGRDRPEDEDGGEDSSAADDDEDEDEDDEEGRRRRRERKRGRNRRNRRRKRRRRGGGGRGGRGPGMPHLGLPDLGLPDLGAPDGGGRDRGGRDRGATGSIPGPGEGDTRTPPTPATDGVGAQVPDVDQPADRRPDTTDRPGAEPVADDATSTDPAEWQTWHHDDPDIDPSAEWSPERLEQVPTYDDLADLFKKHADNPVAVDAILGEMDRRELAEQGQTLDEQVEALTPTQVADVDDAVGRVLDADPWGLPVENVLDELTDPPKPTRAELERQVRRYNQEVIQAWFDRNAGDQDFSKFGTHSEDLEQYLGKRAYNTLLNGNGLTGRELAKKLKHQEEAALAIWGMLPKEIDEHGFARFHFPGTARRDEWIAQAEREWEEEAARVARWNQSILDGRVDPEAVNEARRAAFTGGGFPDLPAGNVIPGDLIAHPRTGEVREVLAADRSGGKVRLVTRTGDRHEVDTLDPDDTVGVSAAQGSALAAATPGGTHPNGARLHGDATDTPGAGGSLTPRGVNPGEVLPDAPGGTGYTDGTLRALGDAQVPVRAVLDDGRVLHGRTGVSPARRLTVGGDELAPGQGVSRVALLGGSVDLPDEPTAVRDLPEGARVSLPDGRTGVLGGHRPDGTRDFTPDGGAPTSVAPDAQASPVRAYRGPLEAPATGVAPGRWTTTGRGAALAEAPGHWSAAVVPTVDGGAHWSVNLPDGTRVTGDSPNVAAGKDEVAGVLATAADTGDDIGVMPRHLGPGAPSRPVNAPEEAPEAIGGRRAEWVNVADVAVGERVRVTGSLQDGSDGQVAGVALSWPTPVTAARPGDLGGDARYAVVVGENPDGTGTRQVVYVRPDAVAARAVAEGPDSEDAGELLDANEADVLTGRVPGRVPVDQAGRGLYPGSLVTAGGREGIVTASRPDDVTVAWEDGREDDLAATTLTVQEGGQARPAGWTTDGRRVTPGSVVTIPGRPGAQSASGARTEQVRGTVEATHGDTVHVSTPSGVQEVSAGDVKVLRAADEPATPGESRPFDQVIPGPALIDPLPQGQQVVDADLSKADRDALVSLGFDLDSVSDPQVAQAALRVRHNAGITPEQAAALAQAVEDATGPTALESPWRRSMKRLARALRDAANTPTRPEPGEEGKVEKVTPDQVGPGDTIALPDNDGSGLRPVVVDTVNPGGWGVFDEEGNRETVPTPENPVHLLPDTPEEPADVPDAEDRAEDVRREAFDTIAKDRARTTADVVGEAAVRAIGDAGSIHDLRERVAQSLTSDVLRRDVERVAERMYDQLDRAGVEGEERDRVLEDTRLHGQAAHVEARRAVLATINDAEPIPGESMEDTRRRVAQLILTAARHAGQRVAAGERPAPSRPERTDRPVRPSRPEPPALEPTRPRPTPPAPTPRDTDAVVDAALTPDEVNAMTPAQRDRMHRVLQEVHDRELRAALARIMESVPEGRITDADIDDLESVVEEMLNTPEVVPGRPRRVRAATNSLRPYADPNRPRGSTTHEVTRWLTIAVGRLGAAIITGLRALVDKIRDGREARQHIARIARDFLAGRGRRRRGDGDGDDPTPGGAGPRGDGPSTPGGDTPAGRSRRGRFGTKPVRKAVFGRLTRAQLDSGRAEPTVRDTFTVDQAADGGPGQATLARLADLTATGARIGANGEHLLEAADQARRVSAEADRAYRDATVRRAPLAEVVELQKAAKKVRDTMRQRFHDAAADPSTLEGLRGARDMGETGGASLGLRGDREGVEAARWALQHFPTDWIRAASANGEWTVKIGRRGEVDPESRTITLADLGEGEGAPGGPLGRNALHELTHVFEAVVPELGSAQRAYHFDRTSTGRVGNRTREGANALRPLREIDPTAGHHYGENTRVDDYPHPYMGREYEDMGHFEIMSMLMESLFGGAQHVTPQMRQFALGVLADLGKEGRL